VTKKEKVVAPRRKIKIFKKLRVESKGINSYPNKRTNPTNTLKKWNLFNCEKTLKVINNIINCGKFQIR
jgi:hypothetical protein